MNRQQVMSFARLAGEVRRYHTWPVHRVQSVGEHTWQVMRIWFQIFGPMSPDVSSYILWSDAGELHTGDSPFPFKVRNPDVKELMDEAEAKAVAEMGGYTASLSEEDHLRYKVCEYVEMMEFGLNELHMGNEFARPVAVDCYNKARELSDRLPALDQDLIDRYLVFIRQRYRLGDLEDGSHRR